MNDPYERINTSEHTASCKVAPNAETKRIPVTLVICRRALEVGTELAAWHREDVATLGDGSASKSAIFWGFWKGCLFFRFF